MDEYEGYDIFQSYELGNTLFLSQRFLDTAGEWVLTNLHCTPAEKSGKEFWDYFIEGNENT